MHSPLHTRWREAVRERDDKRGTRAPESCGRREAPAAKPLGVRPADAGRAGRHPAGGRVRVGTARVGETAQYGSPLEKHAQVLHCGGLTAACLQPWEAAAGIPMGPLWRRG